MQIENERPAHHPGKIFPLTACFGDAGKGTLGYYLVHGVKQEKDGTKVLVSDAAKDSGFYAISLKPDPGTDKVFAALMQDYMAGQPGDLTEARLEKLGPSTCQTAELLYKRATAVEGKGIYLGLWEPKNDRGQGAIFDIYAAPEDIKDGSGQRLFATFNEAAAHIAQLKGFHGYDGSNLAYHRAVFEAAFSDPAALSKWFIPSEDLLDAMHGLRQSGGFRDTFSEGGGMLSGRDWYHGSLWRDNYGRDFGTDKTRYYFDKYGKKAYTRPVRAEWRPAVPSPGPA